MFMLLKAQRLVPNRQSVQALALTLANVRTLGKILKIFKHRFLILNGESISPYSREVGGTEIMHSLISAHAKTLTHGSWD